VKGGLKPSSSRLAMISVLCVDDDSAYLDITKRYLEEPGALTITTALSATEALNLMETNRFDTVVADYSMPVMDGIELLKAVRAGNPSLPFILYTGKGREEVVIEAFNNGADFYLQKSGEPQVQFANLKDTILRAVKLGAVWEGFHDSETRYRRLFETAQDGILILDAESGEITDANPFLLNLIGYSHHEILGKHFWDIGVFKDIDISKNSFLELQKKKYIRYENLPLQTKNGQEIYVEFVSNVYAIDHTNVIQCNIHDITERKKGENALRETKNYLEKLIHYANAPIIVWNPEFRITEFNHAFETLTGMTRDEVIGQPLEILLPNESREKSNALIRSALRGKRVEIVEIPIQHVSGNTHIVLWNSANILNPEGNVIATIAQGQDITDRKKMEEELKTFNEDLEYNVVERTSDLTDINIQLMTEIDIRLAAEQHLNKLLNEKEVLIREVHHRIKNNLQIIISLLNLQSRYVNDEKTLAAIRESQNRVKAMALVHEKLYHSEDISKIGLDEYIRFLGNGLFQFYGMKGKGITLKTDIQNISVDINTAIPLGLIINELVSNSLKYAFPGGRKGEISIAIKRENNSLSILFRDNGVGIPQDFDWRNVKSLGLRLVISLVEQLQGTIELDRTTGTVFKIIVKEKK
jgi:PAS domain S-box-containing protein